MPNLLKAKEIAESALRVIGSFTPNQIQADEGELRVAMQWLELTMNDLIGSRPISGYWATRTLTLRAGVNEYTLDNEIDLSVQELFSASLIEQSGTVYPMAMLFENQAVEENEITTGTPYKIVITRDKFPKLKVYPMPTQSDVDSGRVIRLRFQTYEIALDRTGVQDNYLYLRASWQLFAIKKLAYEIGIGPVRHMNETELQRLQSDCMMHEQNLLSRDGLYDTGQPPVTESSGM